MSGSVVVGGVGGRERTSTRRCPYDSVLILEVTIGEVNWGRCIEDVGGVGFGDDG